MSSGPPGYDGSVSSPTSAEVPALGPGLRLLKKRRTFLSILDAALDLFAEQGFEATTVDQIAARAEVSTATFFRYFSAKDEVLFSGFDDQLSALKQAIVERPNREEDFVAVRRAVVQQWVPMLDHDRVALRHRVTTSSPRLRDSSLHLGIKWQRVISDGLATRRGLDNPDRKARLVAAVAMAVFGNAVDSWVTDGRPGELAAAVDDSFALLFGSSAKDARPRRQPRP